MYCRLITKVWVTIDPANKPNYTSSPGRSFFAHAVENRLLPNVIGSAMHSAIKMQERANAIPTADLRKRVRHVGREQGNRRPDARGLRRVYRGDKKSRCLRRQQ